MTQQNAKRLRAALASGNSSTRLRAALAAGTTPEPEYVDVLIEQCAIEPDFFVRDMLTWALTRHDDTVDRLVSELRSDVAQARSQALHTLSKIGDRRAWPAISTELLQDADDEVARAAWRTAVALVPDDERAPLARTLVTQLGRGERDVQRSLSRALAELGDIGRIAVLPAKQHRGEQVRAHAYATERLINHPDEDFAAAIEEARRTVALIGAPIDPA